MKKALACAVAICGLTGLGAASPAAAANLLVNGSFEGGPPLNFAGYARGLAPSGWSGVPFVEVPDIINDSYVTANSGALGGYATYLYAQDGVQFLDMNGASETGALFQDVLGLAPGSTVTLTFWSGRWAQNSTGNLLASLVDPDSFVLLGSEAIYFDHQPGLTSGSWTQYSVSGTVGAGGKVRVLFAGDSPATNRAALALDNVVLDVSAVPEPASWAMMIGGFALAGAAMRRSRSRVAFAG